MANLTGGILLIFRGLNLTAQRRVRRKAPFSDGNYLIDLPLPKSGSNHVIAAFDNNKGMTVDPKNSFFQSFQSEIIGDRH